MMADRKIIAGIVIVAVILIGGMAVYLSGSVADDKHEKETTDTGTIDTETSDTETIDAETIDAETNDKVTFLVEDEDGFYFWVDGRGTTLLAAWENAADNYNIPWKQALGDNASWGDIDFMYDLGPILIEKVDFQWWPYWAWWMPYTWRDAGNEWASDSLMYTNSSERKFCSIFFGNNSEYNHGPTVNPDRAVVWDQSSDGVRMLIQSPRGVYFWTNGEGTTVYDAWSDAAKSYDISWTKKSDYDGVDSIFGIGSSNQSYWKLYLGNAGGNWTDFSGQSQDDLSTYNVADYDCMALVYGNGDSEPAVDPPAV